MQEVPDSFRARGLGAEIGASSAPLLDEANAIGLNRTRHRVPVVGFGGRYDSLIEEGSSATGVP